MQASDNQKDRDRAPWYVIICRIFMLMLFAFLFFCLSLALLTLVLVLFDTVLKTSILMHIASFVQSNPVASIFIVAALYIACLFYFVYSLVKGMIRSPSP